MWHLNLFSRTRVKRSRISQVLYQIPTNCFYGERKITIKSYSNISANCQSSRDMADKTRRHTYIAQQFLGDLEDKVLEFQKFIIHQRKNFNYYLSQIGNAGQTPLIFHMPYDTTVDTRGAKTVQINTTVNEKKFYCDAGLYCQ